MVTFGYGKDALRPEMAKCDVLCANCHRIVHYTSPEQDRRRWIHDEKRDEGCDRCGESNPACLDFHHFGDEKDATVARLVSDKRSKECIRAEIERCRVLCANCHRKEHSD